MNIGERIKQLRKEKGLSVDYIAEKLGKNRATIYRYESSDIENLPYPILVPLASILGTTPMFLMGCDFDSEEKEPIIMSYYNKLNDLGKNEAIKRVSELTEMNRYTYAEPTTIAAHNDELTEEENEIAFNRALELINKKKK